MIQRKDLLFAIILGEISGIFAIPTIYQIGLFSRLPYPLALLLVIPPLIFLFGMSAAVFLSRFIGILKEIARFAIVGFTNTAVDFGILNTLSFLTGIVSGFWLIPLNIIAFSVAVTNSFFWNKFWVFEKKIGETAKEFGFFLSVTLIGLALNSLFVVLITKFFAPLFGLTPVQWENIAKIIATLVTLVWNFTGYKFWVFRS